MTEPQRTYELNTEDDLESGAVLCVVQPVNTPIGEKGCRTDYQIRLTSAGAHIVRVFLQAARMLE